MPAFISQGINGVIGQFDKTNTTLSDVPNTSFNLRAGQVYSFWANLHLSAPAAGGVKIGIAAVGLSATSFRWNLNVWNGTTMIIGSSFNTATSTGVTLAATYAEIFGAITVNAAGSLNLQFAQNAASGTSSILSSSSMMFLQREPMNPYA